MDYGRLNPFRWHDDIKDISSGAIYRFNEIAFGVTGTATAKLIRVGSGIAITLNADIKTWTINGKSLTTTMLYYKTPVLGLFYIELTIGGVKKYSDYIQMESDTCNKTIRIDNSCDSFVAPWVQIPTIMFASLPAAQIDAPTTETAYETLITETGEEKKLTKQVVKHHIWFVQPKWYRAIMDLLTVTDDCKYESTAIKNITYDEVAINEEMSQFTIHFEYKNLQEGNNCCVNVNLDNILNPDNGGGEDCKLEVSISELSGTLTANVRDDNGNYIVRWYRNGQYISSAGSITVTQPGEYQVVVTEDGCRASDSYYVENKCNVMSVRVYAVGNVVNADINNIPQGCSPVVSVLLNGTEVSNSVPYTASQSGTYFVKVTGCDCEKSGGVYVNYSPTNCTFTLSINKNGNMLESVTNAVSPTYLWELETSSGITTIGATQDVPIGDKGIYWLTVSDGGCTKKVYLYLEPLQTGGVYTRYGGTGTSFAILGIDLRNIINYAGDVLVTINGVEFSYVSGSPSAPNTYGVDGTTGNLLVPTPLTNPAIIVRLI